MTLDQIQAVSDLYSAYAMRGDDDMNARLRVMRDIDELGVTVDEEALKQALDLAQAHYDALEGDDDDLLDDELVLETRKNLCAHDWQEQPGEPPRDVCSRCGMTRE